MIIIFLYSMFLTTVYIGNDKFANGKYNVDAMQIMYGYTVESLCQLWDMIICIASTRQVIIVLFHSQMCRLTTD